MPNKNGRGPAGTGSRTGRGMGNCSPAETGNLKTTRGQGLGKGQGLGRGQGRGFSANQGFGFRNIGRWFGFGGNNINNEKLSSSDERTMLKEQSKFLKEKIKETEERIEEINKDSK